mgnify:CR=1 FL=1|jgi:hypothetical protein|tara:strand:+ start:664 stop:891 length:228 start_codon:yes stop_codon:yes gene_type:complete
MTTLWNHETFLVSEHWSDDKNKYSKVYMHDQGHLVELYSCSKIKGRLSVVRLKKAEDLAESWVLNELNLQEVTKI